MVYHHIGYQDKMRRQYIILSVISLILITAGLLSAWMTPCSGYEPDIYAVTPALFWIGLMLCYLCGIGFTVFTTFRNTNSAYEKYLGYFHLILASTALICLHIIRGYKLINISGDTGTHLGVLREMLASSVLPNTYYPNIYLEPAFLSIVTGLDISTILMYLPIFCIGVMTLGVFVISRRIYPHKGETYFSTLIALLLPSGCAVIVGTYHLYYVGQTISQIALLPIYLLLVVLCFSKVRTAFLPLILVCISVVFYHPNVSVICVIISIVSLGVAVLCGIQRRYVDKKTILSFVGLFLVLVTAFFTYHWGRFGSMIVSGFSAILGLFTSPDSASTEIPPSPELEQNITVDSGNVGGNVGSTINGNISLSGNTAGSNTVSELLAESNIDVFGKGGANFITDTLGGTLSFVEKAFDYGYGIDTIFQIAGINILIYGMFFITGIILLLKYWKSNEYFFLKVFYLVALAVVALVFIAAVGDFTGEYTRFVYILYILALISSGFILYRVFSIFTNSWKKMTTIRIGVIVVVLMLICSLSVISFHPSPYTMTGGYQEPQTQYTGIETFYPYMDNCNYQTTKGITFLSLQRHVVATFGPSMSKYEGYTPNNVLPYHFGYDKGIDSVSVIYPQSTYIILNNMDEEYYDVYFPRMKIARWTNNDYSHFSFDTGVFSVYSNNGLNIYVVVGD